MIEILFEKIHKYAHCAVRPQKLIVNLLVSLGITALIWGSAMGCSPDNSVRYFPVQKAPQTRYLLLAIEGELVLEDGCLRLAYNKFLFWQPSQLIIWPYGYSWVSEESEVWVINEKGEKVARVGDYVKGGGGPSVEPDKVKVYTGQDPPPGIKGPFFVINPDITPQ